MSDLITILLSAFVSTVSSYLFWKSKRKYTLKDIKKQNLIKFHDGLSNLHTILSAAFCKGKEDTTFATNIYLAAIQFIMIYEHNSRLVQFNIYERDEKEIRNFTKSFSHYRVADMQPISTVIKTVLIKNIGELLKEINEKLID